MKKQAVKETSTYERLESELPKDIIGLQEIAARLWYGYFRPAQPLSLTTKREMREDYNRVADAMNAIKPGTIQKLTESTKWEPTKMYETDEAVEAIEEDAEITLGRKKPAPVVQMKPAVATPAPKKQPGKSAVKKSQPAPVAKKVVPAKKAAPAPKKAVAKKAAPVKKKPASAPIVKKKETALKQAPKKAPAPATSFSKDKKQQPGETMYAWICRLFINKVSEDDIMTATGRDRGFVRRNIKHYQKTKGGK